jgi:hypothetical protein
MVDNSTRHPTYSEEGGATTSLKMHIREQCGFCLLFLALSACHDGSSTTDPGDPLYKYQWHLWNTGQPSIGALLHKSGLKTKAVL